MFPYFLILFLIFACAIMDSQSKNRFFKITIFVIFALFAGLRKDVGIDYPNYVKIFEEVDGCFVNEPGNALLFDFLRKIGATAQLYFFLNAIITQLFVYLILRSQKSYFWLVVFMYYCISLFYMASFNAVRNYVAISIMIWSLRFVEKNELLKFSIIVLMVTFCVHFSALIFLPLFFFLRSNHSKWVIFIILIGLVLGSNLLWGFISMTPYAKYDKFDNASGDATVDLLHYFFALVSFLLVCFGQKFRYLRDNVVMYNMCVLCLYTIVLVILQSSPWFAMLFQRYCNYFIFSFLIVIPLVISSMKKQYGIIVKVMLCMVSFLYFLRTVIIKGEEHMIVPYDFDLNLF